MTDAERQELYTLMGQWGRKPEILYQKVREWIEDKKAPEWLATAHAEALQAAADCVDSVFMLGAVPPVNLSAMIRNIVPASSQRAMEDTEIVVITNTVIESLQEEIRKMREAISPGRQNVSCDYYCAVARKMREGQTKIKLMEPAAERAMELKIAEARLETLQYVHDNIPADPTYFWLHAIKDAKAAVERLREELK
jgi:hypothetical protein